MCTMPVPSFLVTKSAANKGTLNLYPKSFKGCLQIVFSSISPLKSLIFSIFSSVSFFNLSISSLAIIKYVSEEFSFTKLYEKLLLKAKARFPGIVQGVVVHIKILTFFLFSIFSFFRKKIYIFKSIYCFFP